MGTILFAKRWMPMVPIMLVLAVPAPRLGRRIPQVFALILVAMFCAVSSVSWMGFEKKELSGLSKALASLPQDSWVLGLDTKRNSEFIQGLPFIQMFAYAQLMKGCRLNSSFARFPSSLVVFKQHLRPLWTKNLEWYPALIKKSDMDYFDFVILNGFEKSQLYFQKSLQLKPVTHYGLWRLYQTRRMQMREFHK
jgi:hypothetical protein